MIAGHEWAVAALPGEGDGSAVHAELVAGGISLAEAREAAARMKPGDVLAVTVAREPPPAVDFASPAIRAAQRLAALMRAGSVRARAAIIDRRLRSAGLETRRVDIGRREDGYPFSLGGSRVRTPADVAVVGARPGAPSPPTVLDRALESAARRLGVSLSVERGRVLASGTVLAELEGHFLRIADPEREPAVTAEGDPVERLLACDPPPLVSGRVVRALARGNVGRLAWSIEERRGGGHPPAVTDELWAECREFLAALATTSRPEGDREAASLADEVTALEPLVEAGHRPGLMRMAETTDRALAGLPRVWGHGDFHPGNLLVRDGLETVLDWDAASPAACPGLDLLHLVAMTEPALRRVPHGVRSRKPLAALAAPGAGRLDRALEQAGVPGDPAIRGALVDLYWLGRLVRDVQSFPDRATRSAWVELNLRRPLAETLR